MTTETDTVTLQDALDEVSAMNAYQLSGPDFADCGDPDSRDSAGAAFLLSVRDSVVESISDDPAQLPDDYDDQAHEIADSAPDVYTHKMWQEFVDLCAYQEDLEELGGTTGEMEKDARVALYIIADRLARALFATVAERAGIE